MKIAIVADWLTNFAGAEQVVLSIHKMFPEAPIYTSVFNEKKMPQFKDAEIKTTFLQKIPYLNKRHQLLLKWMPLAFETLDLSEYDVVISSSHACSKGVITKPQTLHVSYCHTPMRSAWDNYHEYIKKYNINPIIKKLIPRLMTNIRIWDRLAADRVDYFIANSNYIKNRIKKYYRRDSAVIYPPVDTDKPARNTPPNSEKDYYLAVGRIVPNKNMDLLVEAFNKSKKNLHIIGSGVDLKRLSKKANKNIKFLGYINDNNLEQEYTGCRAFIMPQIEDFGIAPVEAMAYGKPVIAFAAGGSLETVIEHRTGIFFKEQTIKSLLEAIKRFEKMTFSPELIRRHASKFSENRFQAEIKKFIEDKYKEWQRYMK
ncbi:glycosyltransferase [Patescibacteria group bacterium]|nr:glycosyltransferase [Patescibacteria group bacterium]